MKFSETLASFEQCFMLLCLRIYLVNRWTIVGTDEKRPVFWLPLVSFINHVTTNRLIWSWSEWLSLYPHFTEANFNHNSLFANPHMPTCTLLDIAMWTLKCYPKNISAVKKGKPNKVQVTEQPKDVISLWGQGEKLYTS